MLMLIVAGTFAGLSLPAPGPADSLRFPVVEGTNLEKKQFTLPADFAGAWNVVLVAFRREQQADVDTWMPHLKVLARAHPALRTYELPTLTRSYRWMRRYIDGGMAGGIPDRTVREHTITLYIDKVPFKRALGIPDEERIRVFLVARDGRVAWSGVGAWTAEADASLRAAMAAVAGAAATPAVSAAGTGS
ncbi:MAG: hypothetical protein U9Q74_08665 [Gemmatimonadota bacterium]|nr:hypothetical protein [Gemmatimonadota bacterium]